MLACSKFANNAPVEIIQKSEHIQPVYFTIFIAVS